jgi:hypothetical protein
MTNINCSETCIHENNGKCSLTHVGITASLIGFGTDCAYFSPRTLDSVTLLKKNKLT